MISDLHEDYQYHTAQIGNVAETSCMHTSVKASETVLLPLEFMTYFAGYTVEWDYYWNLKALKGGPSPLTATDPVEMLNNFGSGVPSCVRNMTDLCPGLQGAISSCYNTTSGGACYCNAITANNCTGLCLIDHQPNDYLHYVVPKCEKALKADTNHSMILPNATTPANWTSMWPDYINISNAAYLQLFPWTWDLRPNATELVNITAEEADVDIEEKPSHCPTVRNTLLSFAIVNAVVFVVSIATANRHVMKSVLRISKSRSESYLANRLFSKSGSRCR